MVSCGREWVNGINGCDGAYQSDTFDFIEKYGAIPESCFPYSSSGGYVTSCSNKCSNWQDLKIEINNWGSVSSSQSSIKNALVQYGPLSAGMEVYSNFGDYSSGVYTPSGSLLGYHLVCIVGYNDNSGYWICKNSWGKGWGENGWFKIKYGVCGIEDEVVYLDVEADQDAVESIKYGVNTYKREGDIYNYDSKRLSMCESIFGSDGKVWYRFDIGGEKIADGMEVGIEFADWGWIGNGPTFYVYDWKNKKYTKLATNAGNNDDPKWVWKITSNSNNYVNDNGIVEVYVYADANDWVILYNVGIKYKNLKPDLQCTGNLDFGSCGTGQQVSAYISVKNAGDSGTELDWKISSWPSWGSWKFSPSSGDNLKPQDGSKSIKVTLTTPSTTGPYSGEVKIVNKSDNGDNEILDVSLTVTKSRQTSTPTIRLLQEKIQQLLAFFSFFIRL
jgi:hypothetical protein